MDKNFHSDYTRCKIHEIHIFYWYINAHIWPRTWQFCCCIWWILNWLTRSGALYVARQLFNFHSAQRNSTTIIIWPSVPMSQDFLDWNIQCTCLKVHCTESSLYWKFTVLKVHCTCLKVESRLKPLEGEVELDLEKTTNLLINWVESYLIMFRLFSLF